MSTSNMPARIWAETVDHPWSLWSVAKESGDDTLYIRADIAEAMAEALEWANAHIDGRAEYNNPVQCVMCIERLEKALTSYREASNVEA